MIQINQKKITYDTIQISQEEAAEITVKYLKSLFGEEGTYVTKDGRLEHCASWLRGPGIITQKGKASKLQLAADKMLAELER